MERETKRVQKEDEIGKKRVAKEHQEINKIETNQRLEARRTEMIQGYEEERLIARRNLV